MITSFIAAALAAAAPVALAQPADAHAEHAGHAQGRLGEHDKMDCCKHMQSDAKMDCCKDMAAADKAKCCAEHAASHSDHHKK